MAYPSSFYLYRTSLLVFRGMGEYGIPTDDFDLVHHEFIYALSV